MMKSLHGAIDFRTTISIRVKGWCYPLDYLRARQMGARCGHCGCSHDTTYKMVMESRHAENCPMLGYRQWLLNLMTHVMGRAAVRDT